MHFIFKKMAIFFAKKPEFNALIKKNKFFSAIM